MAQTSNPSPEAPEAATDAETHFGFERVSADEKDQRVRGVFSSVASRYDIMNDVMSAGMHRLWKRHFVEQIALAPGRHYLDLASGTGDIAFRLQDRFAQFYTANQATCWLTDVNTDMLRCGRDRALDDGRLRQSQPMQFDYAVMNAESLPLPDRSVDTVSMAFGIRNVTHREKALKEIHRVLKYGGCFHCLEFSPEVLPALQTFYDRYSFDLIPRLGQWITGDGDSYQYLVESIRQFPPPLSFADELRATGFSRVTTEPLQLGVVAIVRGWKS